MAGWASKQVGSSGHVAVPDDQIFDFHRSFTATATEGEELRTAGGVILPQTAGHLSAWVKLAGEPPQVLYETPVVFMERWRDWQERVAAWEHAGKPGLPPVLICHDHAYGQALFFLPGVEIAYVGVTYPTSIQGRTTPGSIWAGQCRCGEFGGPCPSLQ